MTRYYKIPTDPTCRREDDPNCYTYVDGYGFTPPPPLVTERRILQRYSNGLGFATLLYFILTAFVPFFILSVIAIFQPAIRIYGNQVLASSHVIMLVNVLSSAICLFVPFLLFVLLCRVPLNIASPFFSVAVHTMCICCTGGQCHRSNLLQPDFGDVIDAEPAASHRFVHAHSTSRDGFVWDTAVCDYPHY